MPIPNITSTLSPVNAGTLVPTALLNQMLTSALALAERAANHPDADYKKAWFGNAALTNNHEIDAWARKVYGYLNGGLRKLDFSCCATAGSIASFAQYSADKVRGGKENLPTVRKMQLNAGFHSARYSYGEKVGSILHEITHMSIGTNDEKLLDRECYGAPLCGALARIRPELALTNADNWGYYFTNYHVDLNWTGDDWKYLTEAEVEERAAGMPCTVDKGVPWR